MKQPKKNFVTLAAIGLGMLAWLGLTACFEDSSGGSSGEGIVVSTFDTTTVTITLTKSTSGTWSFGANDTFNVKKVRDKLDSNNIDLNTIQITNFEVTFDDTVTTVAFIDSNAGVPFYMRISTQTPGDTTALETSKTNYLTFSAAVTAYQLNQNIFANSSGISKLTKAIQDTTVNTVPVRGELDGNGTTPLKKSGTMTVNFITTVGGKIKP